MRSRNEAPGFFASGYSSISTGSEVNLPCGMVSSTASPKSSSIVIVRVPDPGPGPGTLTMTIDEDFGEAVDETMPHGKFTSEPVEMELYPLAKKPGASFRD